MGIDLWGLRSDREECSPFFADNKAKGHAHGSAHQMPLKQKGRRDLNYGKNIRVVVLMTVLVLTVGFVAVWINSARQRQLAESVHEKDLFAMDTYFSLKAYGQNAESGLALCEERVRELETVLSVTAEGSDVWRIDHEHRVSVSEDAFVLIREALQVCEQTEGALDITLYPVLREWGFTTGEYRIPDREVLEGLLKAVDYRRVELEEQTRLVTVPAEAQIDLGAVAKGYTGDALIQVLRQQGVTSAILDLGGNVQTLGAKPDGTPWRVAVRDPFDKSQVAGVLEINDKCVITSGGYERYFTGEDGQIYWHILDPADGEPARNGLVSVTVVGEQGVRCDALSTALFVMGKERATAFWRQQGDFDIILVTEDGELILTEGLKDCFESAAGWAERVAYIQ